MFLQLPLPFSQENSDSCWPYILGQESKRLFDYHSCMSVFS